MLPGPRRAVTGVVFVTAVSFWLPFQTEADTTSTLALSAQVHGRTKLVVSARVLHFTVTNPERPAEATLDFVAASRTRRDGDVVLTIEAQSGVQGPGGAADVSAEVSFAGEGPGTLSGALEPATPVVAGRWTGSGRRAGRLSFSLRTAAEGDYVVPVHLVLSAP